MRSILFAALLLLPFSAYSGEIPSALKTVIQQKCNACHGPNGVAANVGPITEANLILKGYIKDGADGKSYIRSILQSRTMPPKDSPQLTTSELSLFNSWIQGIKAPVATTLTANSSSTLEQKAHQVLGAKCAQCHSTGGSASYVFGDISNLQGLLKERALVPGDAEKSQLMIQIRNGTMPKGRPPLSTAEIAAIADWINSLPPLPKDPTQTAKCVTEEDHLAAIEKDLVKLPSGDRPFYRYISLADASGDEEKKKIIAAALGKTLNSLSWNPKLMDIDFVDPEKTLVRFDIRKLGWTPESWDKIQSQNPYKLKQQESGSKELFKSTLKTEFPMVRGSWLVANATKPPLYHDLLQVPKTEKELENLIGVNAQNDINAEKVVRSGFRDSGVSQQNRVIERHSSKFGYYWKSYDFQSNVDDQNIFAHPLDFKRSGGEMIYQLPNGLQGYFLTNAEGNRLDKAPAAIVQDPKRPDHAVENGISCMRCHSDGLLNKRDQIRDISAVANIFADGSPELARLNALYPTSDIFDSQLAKDNDRHHSALKGLGEDPIVPSDPVTATIASYEGDLNLNQVACDTGLDPQAILDLIKFSRGTLSNMAPLETKCSVPRDSFEAVQLRIATVLSEKNAQPKVDSNGGLDLLALVDGGTNPPAPDTSIKTLNGFFQGEPVVTQSQGKRLTCEISSIDAAGFIHIKIKGTGQELSVRADSLLPVIAEKDGIKVGTQVKTRKGRQSGSVTQVDGDGIFHVQTENGVELLLRADEFRK